MVKSKRWRITVEGSVIVCEFDTPPRGLDPDIDTITAQFGKCVLDSGTSAVVLVLRSPRSLSEEPQEILTEGAQVSIEQGIKKWAVVAPSQKGTEATTIVEPYLEKVRTFDLDQKGDAIKWASHP